MKYTFIAISLVFGLCAVGCGDEAPASGSGAPVSGSGAPASSGTAVALADSDVPVQADFEEEAEKAISQSNYKAELDTLEKEIDSTP